MDTEENLIDIDWEQFLQNNQEIINLLRNTATISEQILVNCSNISVGVETINSNLNHLKEASISAAKLDTGKSESLFNFSNQLEDYLSTNAITIINGLPEIEYNVNLFNTKGDVDSEMEEYLPLISILADIGKEAGDPLCFLLSYGIDIHNGGQSTVGDATQFVWEKIIGKTSGKLGEWVNKSVGSHATLVNASIGTAAVFVFSFVQKSIDNKGTYYGYEVARNVVEAGTDATVYLTALAGASAIGGIPGVALAGVSCMTLSSFAYLTINAFAGDYPIDNYYVVVTNDGLEYVCDIDGPNGSSTELNKVIEKYGIDNIVYSNEYEVPRSVKGSEQTFDVILELMRDKINNN